MSKEDGLNPTPEIMAVTPIKADTIEAITSKEARPPLPPTKSNPRRDLTPLETEMRDDLPELIKKYSQGVSVDEFCEWYGDSRPIIIEAMRSLAERGLAKVIGGKPLAERLVPNSYKPPPMASTDAQDKLFDAMMSLESDGLIKASQRMLSEKSGVPQGSLPVILAMLIGSNRVAKHTDGGNGEPNVYKIVHTG